MIIVEDHSGVNHVIVINFHVSPPIQQYNQIAGSLDAIEFPFGIQLLMPPPSSTTS